MSDGLHEAAPLPLNSSGIARIRHWLRTVLGLDRPWDLPYWRDSGAAPQVL